jgi:hypothetical protein
MKISKNSKSLTLFFTLPVVAPEIQMMGETLNESKVKHPKPRSTHYNLGDFSVLSALAPV